MSPLLPLLVWAALTQAWEDKLPRDKLADDDVEAVERVRQRLRDKPLKATYGVVLVTGPKETSWSQLTVPIWRAYCEHHGFDFFLQQEALNTDLRFEWSKPRVLMEVLPKARWRYALLVDANTLPAAFHKSWDYAIRQHMRHRRFANDDVSRRHAFCPWDCEESYVSAYEEGACYGPLLAGCIFWAKRPKTLQLVQSWYAKRAEPFLADQALVKSFHKMKERNWDEVFYKDVMKEFGRKHSTFLATFTFDEKHGWNTRDQVYEYIGKHKELAALANSLASKSKSEEL